jgi:predicted ribosome quality control (RQC) complex YloA/Tae2 family protein
MPNRQPLDEPLRWGFEIKKSIASREEVERAKQKQMELQEEIKTIKGLLAKCKQLDKREEAQAIMKELGVTSTDSLSIQRAGKLISGLRELTEETPF